jgi:SAM-dependent methyltransferase
MTTYNTIGHQYNATRTADPYLAHILFELLQPQPQGTYLDIGCGTGNYTIALANKGVKMYGVDPSTVMLDEAKAKSNAVHWQIGNAEQLPFADEFFDGAMATLTLHHWDSLDKGFAELYRVLKPQSRMVIFAAIGDLTQHFWLNNYFPKMLQASVNKEPKYSAVEGAVAKAGFKLTATQKYYIQDDLQDKFMYVGKNQPHLYFDEQIRQGISSFAQLSLKEEVEQGLAQLKNDIDNGTFEAVKNRYNDANGDYLFMVIEK